MYVKINLIFGHTIGANPRGAKRAKHPKGLIRIRANVNGGKNLISHDHTYYALCKQLLIGHQLI